MSDIFGSGRASQVLIVGPDGFDAEAKDALRVPFATLVAVNSATRVQRIAADLIAAGCKYFVCVGANSEAIHDLIDDLVVSQDATNVTTTFHDDESDEDAVGFFLTCAANGMRSLLAVVEPGSHAERAIRRVFAASRDLPRC